MDNLIVLAVIAVTGLLFIVIFWNVIKKLVINSIVGIILIILLNLVFGLNIDLGNLFILVSVALFGLPAVGTLLLLRLGGLI